LRDSAGLTPDFAGIHACLFRGALTLLRGSDAVRQTHHRREGEAHPLTRRTQRRRADIEVSHLGNRPAHHVDRARSSTKAPPTANRRNRGLLGASRRIMECESAGKQGSERCRMSAAGPVGGRSRQPRSIDLD
jgi:hypothetical protein